MATYNRAHLISEGLQSIAAQTIRNWECLVVDDGSSDNTEELVKKISNSDKRFKYFKRSTAHLKGLPGSRNYGLNQAQGDYIVFFDDDDLVHPQNLEICLGTIKRTEMDFCHFKKRSFTETVPKQKEIPQPVSYYGIGLKQIEQVVTNEIALASCTVLWKKECFEKLKFNESLAYAEEWELYTRILSEGYYGVGIDEILYFNRKHHSSNTSEFWEGDQKRRDSNEKAIKLVIDNFQNKDLLSRYLIRHFIQMSVFLKNKIILEHVLAKSNLTSIEKLKYRFFYKCYPVLVLGHRTKKLLKK